MEFRRATREDIPLLLEFIRGMAVHHKMLDELVATEEILEKELFDRDRAEVIFCMEDGKEVGYALYFHSFSTFAGRSSLYLEDLYILPDHRGDGYGTALFLELARIAHEHGSNRMKWLCSDWNESSLDFYHALGAEPMEGWIIFELDPEGIARLAQEREDRIEADPV